MFRTRSLRCRNLLRLRMTLLEDRIYQRRRHHHHPNKSTSMTRAKLPHPRHPSIINPRSRYRNRQCRRLILPFLHTNTKFRPHHHWRIRGLLPLRTMHNIVRQYLTRGLNTPRLSRMRLNRLNNPVSRRRLNRLPISRCKASSTRTTKLKKRRKHRRLRLPRNPNISRSVHQFSNCHLCKALPSHLLPMAVSMSLTRIRLYNTNNLFTVVYSNRPHHKLIIHIRNMSRVTFRRRTRQALM